MKYRAEVERDGRFWLVHVPEIGQYTQARNLREVEPMARDLIAVMQEIEPNSFEVEVSIQVPAEAKEHWDRSRELHELADAIRSEAATEASLAARTLVDGGMTLREVGGVLDISFQRAGQLAAQPVIYNGMTEAFRQALECIQPFSSIIRPAVTGRAVAEDDIQVEPRPRHSYGHR